MLALAHKDIEWRPALSPGGIERNVFVGRDGIERWLTEVPQIWGVFELSDPRYQAVGDRVLVLLDVRVRGQTSGIELEAALARVYEIEEALVRRVTGYQTKSEALEAVGLSE